MPVEACLFGFQGEWKNGDLLHAFLVLRGNGFKIWGLMSKTTQSCMDAANLTGHFDAIVAPGKGSSFLQELMSRCGTLGLSPQQLVFLNDGVVIENPPDTKMDMEIIHMDRSNLRMSLDKLKMLLGRPDLRLYPDANGTRVPTTLFCDCGYGNGRIVLDCFGCAENPVVIFLHGGGQTRHSWSSTAKVLLRTKLHT
jgi:hypothetical protein